MCYHSFLFSLMLPNYRGYGHLAVSLTRNVPFAGAFAVRQLTDKVNALVFYNIQVDIYFYFRISNSLILEFSHVKGGKLSNFISPHLIMNMFYLLQCFSICIKGCFDLSIAQTEKRNKK